MQAIWNSLSPLPQQLPEEQEALFAAHFGQALGKADAYALLINISRAELLYASASVAEVLGYMPEEISFPFLLSRIPVHEQSRFIALEQTAVAFMKQLPASERMGYRVRYDTCILRRDGKEIPLRHEMVVLALDLCGDPLYTLALHTALPAGTSPKGLSFLPLREGLPTYADIPLLPV